VFSNDSVIDELINRNAYVIGAASIGAALGILAHVSSYRGDTSGPNRMLEELKS
jgi:carbonic anhydrase/acetyltransferase-like protein (isoleucine patch superfamily)